MESPNDRGTGRRDTDKKLRKSVGFLFIFMVGMGVALIGLVIILAAMSQSHRISENIAYEKGRQAGFAKCRMMYDEVIDPLLKETP